MQLAGDPDLLLALASRIAADADAVRSSAHALDRHAADVQWYSTAADAFRGRVAGDVRALEQAAAALDEAAAILRRHADEVRDRLDFLRDVAERAVDIGEGLVKDAAGVVHKLVDGRWW